MNHDSAKWFGPFYFNKNDARIIAPKINPSLGGTFDLASPYAIIILIVSIVVTALYSI